MARTFRLRLTGDPSRHFLTFRDDGITEIPGGTEIVVSEAEAAAYLKRRGASRWVEVIEIVDDSEAPTPQQHAGD